MEDRSCRTADDTIGICKTFHSCYSTLRSVQSSIEIWTTITRGTCHHSGEQGNQVISKLASFYLKWFYFLILYSIMRFVVRGSLAWLRIFLLVKSFRRPQRRCLTFYLPWCLIIRIDFTTGIVLMDWQLTALSLFMKMTNLWNNRLHFRVVVGLTLNGSLVELKPERILGLLLWVNSIFWF